METHPAMPREIRPCLPLGAAPQPRVSGEQEAWDLARQRHVTVKPVAIGARLALYPKVESEDMPVVVEVVEVVEAAAVQEEVLVEVPLLIRAQAEAEGPRSSELRGLSFPQPQIRTPSCQIPPQGLTLASPFHL
jgi:hypothetical protein